MLRLTTFGGLGLRVAGGDRSEGVPVPDLPPRAFALLVLLASVRGTGISRDSLLAYLWPESDMEHGRNALRQALHSLKRDLAAPELVMGGFMLHLNRQQIASDVQEFETARATGDHARAIECYTGPFLDGFHLGGAPEFERWVEGRRADYEAQVASILEDLARRAGEGGDPGASVEWWRRLATLDPLNSRASIGLVEAMAAAGNPAGALRHAQVHEALVREELDAAPDPALTALVERIRSGTRPMPERPAAAPSQRDRPGDRFRERVEHDLSERYAIEGEPELARDGPVRVLRARDRRYHRLVTLRVLHPALASQLDVERFVREIRLTSKLLHPHILPLLDSGDVAGLPWYAVPHVEGEPLRRRLAREGQIEPQEAVRLARELGDALGYAHAHGIVHRDLNPENVVLAGGHAMLTNLGVARALDTAAGGSLTDSGVMVGSPAYMSPEQALGRPIDGRSDQYALAAVLVEMLTGEPLFAGPTPQAIIAKRAAEPTPDRVRLSGVPVPLIPVLQTGLALRPEDRYATMAAFVDALAAPPPLAAGKRWWSRLRRRR